MNRQGTAYHEAGHAVVAWSLGLDIGGIAIGIGGDETKGKTEIASEQEHLSTIDRLAICLAGLEAQEVFQCPPHECAGVSDLDKAIEIIGEDASEGQSRKLLAAGYQRARELIVLHEAKVVRLATHLIQHGAIERHEFRFAMNEIP